MTKLTIHRKNDTRRPPHCFQQAVTVVLDKRAHTAI